MLERLRRARAFDGVVRAHSADLYRFAYWLCRDRFVAEELVQETFARAWGSWSDLRDLAAAKAWLFTILRRENARRFQRKQLELVEEELDDLDAVGSAPPLAGTLDDDVALRDAVAQLPPTLAEPLLLQVLGGFQCAEIARMLQTTEGAVMTRVCRARLALRRLLDHSVASSAARSAKRGPR